MCSYRVRHKRYRPSIRRPCASGVVGALERKPHRRTVIERRDHQGSPRGHVKKMSRMGVAGVLRVVDEQSMLSGRNVGYRNRPLSFALLRVSTVDLNGEQNTLSVRKRIRPQMINLSDRSVESSEPLRLCSRFCVDTEETGETLTVGVDEIVCSPGSTCFSHQCVADDDRLTAAGRYETELCLPQNSNAVPIGGEEWTGASFRAWYRHAVELAALTDEKSRLRAAQVRQMRSIGRERKPRQIRSPFDNRLCRVERQAVSQHRTDPRGTHP